MKVFDSIIMFMIILTHFISAYNIPNTSKSYIYTYDDYRETVFDNSDVVIIGKVIDITCEDGVIAAINCDVIMSKYWMEYTTFYIKINAIIKGYIPYEHYIVYNDISSVIKFNFKENIPILGEKIILPMNNMNTSGRYLNYVNPDLHLDIDTDQYWDKIMIENDIYYKSYYMFIGTNFVPRLTTWEYLYNNSNLVMYSANYDYGINKKYINNPYPSINITNGYKYRINKTNINNEENIIFSDILDTVFKYYISFKNLIYKIPSTITSQHLITTTNTHTTTYTHTTIDTNPYTEGNTYKNTERNMKRNPNNNNGLIIPILGLLTLICGIMVVIKVTCK